MPALPGRLLCIVASDLHSHLGRQGVQKGEGSRCEPEDQGRLAGSLKAEGRGQRPRYVCREASVSACFSGVGRGPAPRCQHWGGRVQGAGPGELRPDGQLGHRDADVSGLVGRIPRAKASPACVGRPSPSEAPLPGVGTESQWAGWGDSTPALPSGAASEALLFPQAGRGGPGPAQRRPARARRSSCCSGRHPPSCCGSSRKWGSSAPRCALCAVCSSAASGRRPPHTGTPMLSSPCSPPRLPSQGSLLLLQERELPGP